MDKTLIIAEAGVNHNGQLKLAKDLVSAAADAGADRVKFQTFSAGKLVAAGAGLAAYQAKNIGQNVSQKEMLQKLELSYEDHLAVMEQCQIKDIAFLSSPFDEEAADFLVNRLKLKQIKIPSGEITNAPLLLKLAQSGCAVILSTGMCDLKDIEAALGVLAFGYSHTKEKPSLPGFATAFNQPKSRETLQDKVILLHCTSNYPATSSEVNLRAMGTLRKEFGLPVGYSDHTNGIEVALAAVAMGAVCIEKHFTLDKDLPGPDHKASLDPQELAEMVRGIRSIELALGSEKKEPQASEFSTRKVARKSLVAAGPIAKGEELTSLNVVAKRPGTGLSPFHYWDLLGKRASRDYKEDDLLQEQLGQK